MGWWKRKHIIAPGAGLRQTCRSRDRGREQLDQHAKENDWLARFPMHDWVGGRTSVMSAVGLLADGAARI